MDSGSPKNAADMQSNPPHVFVSNIPEDDIPVDDSQEIDLSESEYLSEDDILVIQNGALLQTEKNGKRRANFNAEAKACLEQWLSVNLHYPYPSDEEKAELAKKTGLNKKQIADWFINARRRTFPEMLCKKTDLNLAEYRDHLKKVRHQVFGQSGMDPAECTERIKLYMKEFLDEHLVSGSKRDIHEAGPSEEVSDKENTSPHGVRKKMRMENGSTVNKYPNTESEDAFPPEKMRALNVAVIKTMEEENANRNNMLYAMAIIGQLLSQDKIGDKQGE